MPRPKSEDELQRLRTDRDFLNERIKEVEARDKAKKAAEDHRRWQLAGQVAVQRMQAAPDSEFFKTMMGLLDEHARSASDRNLFGLTTKTSNGSGRGDRAEPGATIAFDHQS